MLKAIKPVAHRVYDLIGHNNVSIAGTDDSFDLSMIQLIPLERQDI